MANKRISTLDPLTTPADGDILPITDVDDLTGSAQGTTKGVTVNNLMGQAPVQSVNTATGAVVLDADDIDDASTSHKFVTVSDITNLSNLSGTNSGDQDLSALATQVSLGNHEALTSAVHGISAFGATLVDDADAATARTTMGLGTAATTASTDYATSAQGALADSAQQPPTEGAFVDGDKTKLDGIEASADVTDTANVEAAGALMDSEVTNLAQVKAFDSADYATASQGDLADTAIQPLGITNMVETTDSIDVLADVDTSTVAPTTNDFLKWGGSNWVPAVPTADVDTPLTTALRGTDNPHIGAYPDQSFKVMDNPSKSAMVIADADGNVTYLLKDSAAEVRVAKGASGTPSRFALASDLPAFVLENDTGEPDIEVTEPTSGEKISVISGDSDTKGANGLPTRQGYNLPDIGANPAPLLISGGSIA